MYIKPFLSFMLLLCLSTTSFAQKVDTAFIKLSENNSIYAAVEQRVKDEVKILDNAIGFDSIMKSRVTSNIYTINQMYFETIRHMNYTIEKMLLREQVKYINAKRDFLKLFLSKDKYKKYLTLEAEAIKKDQKRYEENPTNNEEVLDLRKKAQGWDLLNQTIILSD